MRRHVLLVSALLALVACNSSTAPKTANVQGVWVGIITINDASPRGHCLVDTILAFVLPQTVRFTLSLEQSGGSVTGRITLTDSGESCIVTGCRSPYLANRACSLAEVVTVIGAATTRSPGRVSPVWKSGPKSHW